MGHVMVFYLFGALAIVLALFAVLHKNVFKSATFLAGMLFCTAGLFVVLDAEFVAVVQVLVYIGAITILIVFAIMLTMRINDEMREPFNAQKKLAPVIVAGILGVILVFLLKGSWATGSGDASLLPADSLADIGHALLSYFILPFDVVTVLLLIALVGATYLARQDDHQPMVQEVDAEREVPVAEKESENPEVLVH